jgi:hypothetical protein
VIWFLYIKNMSNFFNLLAVGTRSLSFVQTMEMPEFDDNPPNLPFKRHKALRMHRKPRTPAEIMRSAWEDVGNRMWEAVGVVEREYEQ